MEDFNNDISCGVDLMKFELEDGELVEASSFIPVSIKSKAELRPRKWTLEDLISTADGGSARVIGFGSFGEWEQGSLRSFCLGCKNATL